ncbi:hypothetical protein ABQE93_24885 [Mycolicibacterium sp. XJ662]
MSTRSTLADRAENVLIKLSAVVASQKNAAAVNKIENVRQRAKESRKSLHSVLAAFPDLESGGVAKPTLTAAKRKEIAKARQTLKTTATTIVGKDVEDIASRVSTATVDGYLNLAENLYRSLLADIGRAVDRRRCELLPDRIGEPIVSYPGVPYSNILALKRIQTSLQTPVDGLGSVDEGRRRLKEILEAVAEWNEKRPLLDQAAQSQPAEVKRFMAAAASEEGASWDLLTDAVRDWLAREDHAESIRIYLK